MRAFTALATCEGRGGVAGRPRGSLRGSSSRTRGSLRGSPPCTNFGPRRPRASTTRPPTALGPEAKPTSASTSAWRAPRSAARARTRAGAHAAGQDRSRRRPSRRRAGWRHQRSRSRANGLKTLGIPSKPGSRFLWAKAAIESCKQHRHTRAITHSSRTTSKQHSAVIGQAKPTALLNLNSTKRARQAPQKKDSKSNGQPPVRRVRGRPPSRSVAGRFINMPSKSRRERRRSRQDEFGLCRGDRGHGAAFGGRGELEPRRVKGGLRRRCAGATARHRAAGPPLGLRDLFYRINRSA